MPGADEDFYSWVNDRQAALDKLYCKLLQILSTQRMADGDCPAAIYHLERLLKYDPEEQAVYGLLMVCYAVTGQIGLAEKTYQQYVRMSKESFGVEPDPIMERLRQIVQQRQLSNLPVSELITSVIQANQNTRDLQLKAAFLAVLKATKAKIAPPKSVGYQRVLQHAQEEAMTNGFSLVGTPHLFLALSAEDNASAQQIFSSMSPCLDDVVRAMRFVLGKGSDSGQDPMGYTLELQNILQIACDLAEDSDADSVDLPHLWLALLSRERELLGQVLKQYNVNRAGLLERIGKIFPALPKV